VFVHSLGHNREMCGKKWPDGGATPIIRESQFRRDDELGCGGLICMLDSCLNRRESAATLKNKVYARSGER